MAKDILKEAIADAKAVREVALVNAKAALEEAFTPKLQNMLSAKLSEELDETYYDEDEKKEMDEMHGGMHYDEDDKDVDLDEMMYDEDEDSMEEKMIRKPKHLEKGATGGFDDEDSMDEEIDLEEILNELELEEDKSLQTEKKEDEEVNEKRDREDESNEELSEDFDLDALLEEINKLDKKPVQTVARKKGIARKGMRVQPLKEKRSRNGCLDVQAELNQTKEALNTVRGELNEVNLLNSKLLYVNRIFKQNDLDDAQKLRVVETLDKAGTTKEAKLIYETIKDSFSISEEAITQEIVKEIRSNAKRTPKKPIRENLGMASKATGTTAPKKPIINESNNMISRFQKLANIKIK